MKYQVVRHNNRELSAFSPHPFDALNSLGLAPYTDMKVIVFEYCFYSCPRNLLPGKRHFTKIEGGPMGREVLKMQPFCYYAWAAVGLFDKLFAILVVILEKGFGA